MDAFGNLNLGISKKVKAGTRQYAMLQIQQILSNDTIQSISLNITTIDGSIHTVNIHEFDIEWDEIFD